MKACVWGGVAIVLLSVGPVSAEPSSAPAGTPAEAPVVAPAAKAAGGGLFFDMFGPPGANVVPSNKPAGPAPVAAPEPAAPVVPAAPAAPAAPTPDIAPDPDAKQGTNTVAEAGSGDPPAKTTAGGGMFFDIFGRPKTPAARPAEPATPAPAVAPAPAAATEPAVTPGPAATPAPIVPATAATEPAPPAAPAEPAKPAASDVVTATGPQQRLYEALDLIQDEQHAEAVPKLEAIINEEPSLLSAWEALGWAYWKLGRKDDTTKLWERLRLIDPANPLVYTLLSKVALSQNDLTKAMEYSRRSLELNPNQYNVRFDLARTLLWSGQVHESVKMLERALAEDPNRLDVALELAKVQTDNWQYEQALPLWMRLREKAPDNVLYLSSDALCKLHTGNVTGAVAQAQTAVELQPDQLSALEVLASAAEFGEHPVDAAPYLRRILETQTLAEDKETTRVRLIRLLIRLNRAEPRVHSLDEAIRLTEDRIKFDPKSVDAHCLLGELLMMDQKPEEAEVKLLAVLRDFNPYNLRAHRGLFEVYLAQRKPDLAREQLQAITAFNPRDPYLNVFLARLESARGDYFRAYEALDRLDEAGRQGTVAVLLYHGLTRSRHFTEALSVDRFRDHMHALQRAGFRFVKAGDLGAFMAATQSVGVATRGVQTRAGDAGMLPVPAASIGGRIRPVAFRPVMRVAVTFDDARRDSMHYGTQVGKDLNLVFSMHVPCGYIQRKHPFISSWEQLKEYDKAGCWEFGSHFMDAAILAPIDTEGRLGHALANRIWLADAQRLETPEEYDQRLAVECASSRAMINEKLGHKANFIAYPFGDVGQEVETNVQEPVGRILARTRENYDIGFIQSRYGYCVPGDDPMLVQRHEVDRWFDGKATVDYLYRNHPFFLVRQMRAEFAALEGKQDLLQECLEQLQDAGYPEAALQELTDRLRNRLARKIAAPTTTGTIAKGPLEMDNLKPYVGVRGEHFQDNAHRSNSRVLGFGGLNLTPNLTLEGRAGVGAYDQDVVEGTNVIVGTGRTQQTRFDTRTYSLSFDERDAGAKMVYTFPSGVYVSGEMLQRAFTGDEGDTTVLAGAAETQIRPLRPLDLLLRYERDVAPSALAVRDGIVYNQLMASGAWRVRDTWDLTMAGIRYGFSGDQGADNARNHFLLGSSWLLHERTGFRVGLRYDYASSDEDSNAYWTPYQLNRYYVEGGFQGTHLQTYYNLKLRLGIGKEGVRPAEQQRYDELAARARVQSFDAGPEPGGDWEAVYGVSASARMPLGESWSLNGEAGYSKNPNYNEFTLLGGLRYKF